MLSRPKIQRTNLQSALQEPAQEKNSNIAKFLLVEWMPEAFLVVFSCNFSYSFFVVVKNGRKVFSESSLRKRCARV